MDSSSSSAYSLMLYGAAVLMDSIADWNSYLLNDKNSLIQLHHIFMNRCITCMSVASKLPNSTSSGGGGGVTRWEQLSGTTSSHHRWKFEATWTLNSDPCLCTSQATKSNDIISIIA
mmetsp:Transcript_21767/g.43575  ORF Transcript_21767/g.43575 Transcript_21767/m.43575 type:complete len:117 (+) Transcript_21767:704-1054(+)